MIEEVKELWVLICVSDLSSGRELNKGTKYSDNTYIKNIFKYEINNVFSNNDFYCYKATYC